MRRSPENASSNNRNSGDRRNWRRDEFRTPQTENLLERAKTALKATQQLEMRLAPSLVLSIRQYVQERWRALEVARVPSINRGELINFFQDGRGPVFILAGSELEYFKQVVEQRKLLLLQQFQEQQGVFFDNPQLAANLMQGDLARITLELPDAFSVFAALLLEEDLVTEANHWRCKIELPSSGTPQMLVFARYKRFEVKKFVAERSAARMDSNWTRENFTETRIVSYLQTLFKSAEEEFGHLKVLLDTDSPVGKLFVHSCGHGRTSINYREWSLRIEQTKSGPRIAVGYYTENGQPDRGSIEQLVWWTFGNATDDQIDEFFTQQ